MRVLRLLAAPSAPLCLAVLVIMLIAVPSPGGAAVALIGAVVGTLIGLASIQLGMLAGSLLFGVRVGQVVIGFGPRVGDWSTPHRAVVLRTFPVVLGLSTGPGLAPVRPRMWAAALVSAITGLGAVAALALLVIDGPGTGEPFWFGALLGAGAAVLRALLPTRTAGSTSTGWTLLRLPGLRGSALAALQAAPVIARTAHAVEEGDLAGAERLATALADRYPDLRAATAARALVLHAHGRYAESMVLTVKLAADPTQAPHEAAGSFAALAGVTCATVEAGQLAADIGLSTVDTALTNARTLGYPAHKLAGTHALLELLRGNAERAIGLARAAATQADDLFDRADDLATLARAHMAAGDNASARVAIGEANRLVPWWPRVRTTKARLEIS